MTAKFLLALGLVAAGIAQSGTVSHENECLPSAEFNIGGISLDSTIDEIEKLRGKPKTICVDNDLFVETLEYDDIKISMSGGRVFYVATSSPKNKTLSGIHCGMLLGEAMKILGYPKYDISKSEYQFVNCSTEVYLILKFSNNILISLEMGNDLP